MDRNLKFRGKRADNGQWVYGDLLRVGGGCLIYFGSKTETATPDISNDSNVAVELFNDEVAVVIPDTIGQFTGLLDCSGKEIYEGDILRCRGKYLYQVEWMTDGFMLRGKTYGGVTSIKSFLPMQRDVIGNINDNPELLKGGENG